MQDNGGGTALDTGELEVLVAWESLNLNLPLASSQYGTFGPVGATAGLIRPWNAKTNGSAPLGTSDDPDGRRSHGAGKGTTGGGHQHTVHIAGLGTGPQRTRTAALRSGTRTAHRWSATRPRFNPCRMVFPRHRFSFVDTGVRPRSRELAPCIPSRPVPTVLTPFGAVWLSPAVAPSPNQGD